MNKIILSISLKCESKSNKPQPNSVVIILLSLVIYFYFFSITNISAYEINIFIDNFTRADGAVGNGWIGSSWAINGNSLVYSPSLIERVINPGAEGLYTNGLAPNWTALVDNGTKSIENSTVHAGSAAEHIGGTGRESLLADTTNVSAGKSYFVQQWIKYVSGTVYVGVRYENSVLVPGYVAVGSPGSYELYETIFAASGPARLVVDANSSGEAYADDFHMYEFDPKERFLARDYSFGDFVVNSAMTYVPSPAKAFNNQISTGPGIVVNLDDPNNPQNYVIAYYDGTHLRLSKFVSGVETNLISILESAPDGDLVEIRKNGAKYQMFTHGNQVGTDQTINDAAILAGSYVGLYGLENSATKFSVFTARPYGTVYASTKSTGSFTNTTIPSGKCVLSLRFDDNNADDYSFIYPLLHARGLVGGFAIVRKSISYGGNDSLTNIKAMQANGMEIMAHSYTHSSDPGVYRTFENETALAVEEMRLIGLNVDSFVQPGSWAGTYYTLMQSTSFLRTAESALLRIYYNAFEGYLWDQIRDLPIPGSYRYGANHFTCDKMSLKDLETIVDLRIKNHKGLEILFHPDSIGRPERISKADFTSFLDYVQKKVNTGQLIVLTPTQQLYANIQSAKQHLYLNTNLTDQLR